MKITFMFRDSEENFREVRTDFNLPLTHEVPDIQARVLGVASDVGKLTEALLYVTCREAGLLAHPVKLTKQSEGYLHLGFRDTVLYFEREKRPAGSRKLAIANPILPPDYRPMSKSRGKRAKSLARSLSVPRVHAGSNQEVRDYYETIMRLADNCLSLLNSDSAVRNEEPLWKFRGYHPRWLNQAALKKANEKVRKSIAAENRRKKQEERRAARLLATPSDEQQSKERVEPVTGAGRRPGAIPGVFQGVQMRSQLEIRFAAQLAERQLRWIYEGERLGEQQYLVDFYLPDLQSWVEVKGRFEARDNFQLPAVAVYLSKERNERLYVYTQSKAYLFHSSGRVKIMDHKTFWERIGR